MYEGIQNIKAIAFVWISKINNKTIDKVEIIDKTPKILKIIALLLSFFFEINAVTVPAKEEIIAIKDNHNAALFTPT